MVDAEHGHRSALDIGVEGAERGVILQQVRGLLHAPCAHPLLKFHYLNLDNMACQTLRRATDCISFYSAI